MPTAGENRAPETQDDWYLFVGLGLAVIAVWVPILALVALILGVILLVRGRLIGGLIVCVLALMLGIGGFVANVEDLGATKLAP